MNDEIATLDFALVFEQFDALFKLGSETRKQNKACSPVSWVGEREWEDINHDCA